MLIYLYINSVRCNTVNSDRSILFLDQMFTNKQAYYDVALDELDSKTHELPFLGSFSQLVVSLTTSWSNIALLSGLEI